MALFNEEELEQRIPEQKTAEKEKPKHEKGISFQRERNRTSST